MKNYLIVLSLPEAKFEIVVQAKNKELPHIVLGRFIQEIINGQTEVKLESGTKMNEHLIPLLKDHNIPMEIYPMPQNCQVCKIRLEPPVWDSRCEDCK